MRGEKTKMTKKTEKNTKKTKMTEETLVKKYIILGRAKDSEQNYTPMDLVNGCFTGEDSATEFTSLEEVIDMVLSMRQRNTEMEFIHVYKDRQIEPRSVYLVYGRVKGTKNKFHAVDLSSGNFVSNLIYASMFYGEEEVQYVVAELNRENSSHEFHWRKQ